MKFKEGDIVQIKQNAACNSVFWGRKGIFKRFSEEAKKEYNCPACDCYVQWELDSKFETVSHSLDLELVKAN